MPDPSDSVDVFNYLGLDPFAPIFPPALPEMRRLLRSLKLLLHPDKAHTNPDAQRAQNELGLNYVVLQAIIDSKLSLDNPAQYAMRLRSLPKSRWLSTWNPHGFENGPLFAPLPSWSRRFASYRSRRSASHSTRRFPSHSVPQQPPIDLSTFPPPGIHGAPRFDGTGSTPAIIAQEATSLLMRMGSNILRRPGACVVIARLQYNGIPACVASATLDPHGSTSCSLQYDIWQGERRLGIVTFYNLAMAVRLGFGCMFAGMAKVQLLGVFSRVPLLVLELYIKMFLRHWQDAAFSR
ncbi:hypothetical protein IWX49DRAFT_594953 [Phyllosticta citricarpa]|uniref:J domain-containing protein n=1 Tax=Phyllosticta citricarpa TaxID=55181 RepID=A0ABR1LC13_9PEZI